MFSVSCHSSGLGVRPHWYSSALYLVPPSCSPCSSFAARVCRGSSPLFADVRCTYVLSIASVAYSRRGPLVFVVSGAKNGITVLGASHLEYTSDRRVVSLPFGVVSIPKSLSHWHIPSGGVVACLACCTDCRMQCPPGVW